MFQILVFKPNILLLLLLETSQNWPILKFSRVMRYEYVLFNSKRVYYFIKNCELQRASISKFCQYIFLKRTSFSDYAVLQVFLVGRERECTAVHYQHKYNRPH